MPIRPALLVPIMLCGAVATGCRPAAGPDEAANQTARDTVQVVEATMINSLDDAITAAVDDLAERRGLTTSAIAVLRADSVTWSDGSLGCPGPGMVYTQALVPGYLIELEAGGTRFRYHGAHERRPRLCPPDRVRDPVRAAER